MANRLQPPLSVIPVIQTSISNTLAAELPPEVRANVIAPLLSQINQWSTQIPALLDASGSTTHINAIFSIRKDLFIAPQFTQCALGINSSELPASFREFVAFISKLIDAQKPDKEKPLPKVRLFGIFILFLGFSHQFQDLQTPWSDY